MTLTINKKTYEAGELVAYVEKLEKENAELKKQQFSLRNERNTFLVQNEQYEKDLIDFNENLIKAKKIIEELYNIIPASMADYAKEPMEHAREFMTEE